MKEFLSLTFFFFLFSIKSIGQSYTDYPEFFKVQSEIQIPDDFIVSSIGNLSVYEDSIAVFVDQSAQRIFWFDLVSKKLKELDPEVCHPGFDTLPLKAFFLNDGTIFITNSAIQGYWFYNDGSCGGMVADKFVAVENTYITRGYKFPIHELYFPPYKVDKPVLINLDRLGNKINEIGLTTISKPYLAFRFAGDGVIATSDNKVYVSTAESSKITSINLETKEAFVTEIYEPNYISKFPDKDITQSRDMSFNLRTFQKILSQNSLNISMAGLTDTLLIQQISYRIENENKIALFIYDRFSDKFINQKIILNERFYFASNSKNYLFKNNENDLDTIENPRILVLEYLGPKFIEKEKGY